MNLLDTLDDLHGKATAGEWAVRPDTDDNGSQHGWYIGNPDMWFMGIDGGPHDVEITVTLHNAWPAISRALRAAAKVNVGMTETHDGTGSWSVSADDADGLAVALEGLVKP